MILLAWNAPKLHTLIQARTHRRLGVFTPSEVRSAEYTFVLFVETHHTVPDPSYSTKFLTTVIMWLSKALNLSAAAYYDAILLIQSEYALFLLWFNRVQHHNISLNASGSVFPNETALFHSFSKYDRYYPSSMHPLSTKWFVSNHNIIKWYIGCVILCCLTTPQVLCLYYTPSTDRALKYSSREVLSVK